MVDIMKNQFCAFKALCIPENGSGILCFSNMPMTPFKSPLEQTLEETDYSEPCEPKGKWSNT